MSNGYDAALPVARGLDVPHDPLDDRTHGAHRTGLLMWATRTGVARRDTFAFLALVALAALIRFPTLDVQSYEYDEAVTVKLLRMGFGGMLAAIPDSESTPPLYYVVAWAWTQLFGTGEVGLRALSASFGTAVVPVAYAATSRLAGRRAGIVAGALTAVNPLLVWFSQEARAYALLVLLAGLSFLCFVKALDARGPRALHWWAVTSAAALATHYFALFVIAPMAVWLVLRARPRVRVRWAIAAVGATGASLLPLALHQRSQNLAPPG